MLIFLKKIKLQFPKVMILTCICLLLYVSTVPESSISNTDKEENQISLSGKFTQLEKHSFVHQRGNRTLSDIEGCWLIEWNLSDT